jgi:lysophospholipase L1-like esterase
MLDVFLANLLSRRHIGLKLTIAGYLLVVHCAVVIGLFHPILFISVLQRFGLKPSASFYNEKLAYQLLWDSAIPPSTVILIGDSQIQGFDTSTLSRHAANYGIGGDTVIGVSQRLPLYRSMAHAQAIVLEVGTNDLGSSPLEDVVRSYRQMLSAIPAEVPVVVNAVLPVSQTKSAQWRGAERRNNVIRMFNEALIELCAAHPRCTFIDPGAKLSDSIGDLSPEYDAGDGSHLNTTGYRIWSEMLRKTLADAR